MRSDSNIVAVWCKGGTVAKDECELEVALKSIKEPVKSRGSRLNTEIQPANDVSGPGTRYSKIYVKCRADVTPVKPGAKYFTEVRWHLLG